MSLSNVGNLTLCRGEEKRVVGQSGGKETPSPEVADRLEWKRDGVSFGFS